MARHIKTKQEVETFLSKTKKLVLSDEKTHINNKTWADGKVNKTQKYMAETGITGQTIRAVIRELEVSNYSSTKDDVNPYFRGEQVWEFGLTKSLVDQEEDLYIKLKIRVIDDDELLIMSFHPEAPIRVSEKLTFPFKDNIEQISRRLENQGNK